MDKTNSIPASRSEAILNELVLPNHGNILGNVLGGTVMHWIDMAAVLSARRHCRRMVVTAAISELSFLNPIRVGGLAILKSKVVFTGRTSMEVKVEVYGEELNTGNVKKTSTAYVTMVAIDDHGDLAEVPRVLPETDEEKREFEEAKARREEKLKRKKEL
ncbi:MAG: acyl-CoA thioesterase [candidate division Zixibacteria bacterium]|nr:acyl-CoA thioesterase [candidate division Zixibacteria bacterium]